MAAKQYIISFITLTIVALLGFSYAYYSQEIVYAPADVQAAKVAYNQPVQLSGRVAEGSLRYLVQEKAYQFIIQDTQATLTVLFQKTLPSDFHEGQMVQLRGQLQSEQHFTADAIDMLMPEVKSPIEG